jgi:hypothetical protein
VFDIRYYRHDPKPFCMLAKVRLAGRTWGFTLCSDLTSTCTVVALAQLRPAPMHLMVVVLAFLLHVC